MTILFSASEVGSARALLPIVRECVIRGESVVIDRRGYFEQYEVSDIEPLYTDQFQASSMRKETLNENHITKFVFSSNVHDPNPLILARAAQEVGIKTYHVLDYWNGYGSRMSIDGGPAFSPEIYFVPDEHAKAAAINEDIAEETLVVSGQPAFADILSTYEISQNKIQDLIEQGGMKESDNLILFISEPVADDQGSSIEENINFRGYTEKDSLRILIDSIKNEDTMYRVGVIPHPRQDTKQLENLWKTLGGESIGRIYEQKRGYDLLPLACGVIGMASTMLYEAWLLGFPVLSIQPGLINNSLRMMQKREGVTFIDDFETATYEVQSWLANLSDRRPNDSNEELNRHQRAPSVIVDCILAD